MRELRFMVEGKEIMDIDFGTSPSRGSNNYPRLYVSLDGTRKNFEERDRRGKLLTQKAEGWLSVEWEELKFRTLNPKDDQPVCVNILPGILNAENPLTIESYVYYDSWFGGPNSFSSCDGWEPLKSLPIFQMIDGHWYKVYPEWEDSPYFECAADINRPELGTTTSASR